MQQGPTQPELPGVEVRIPEIHALAVEYKAIRDERQELTAQETKLKSDLMAIMKEKGIQRYRCEGVEAQLVVTKEMVRVRIAKNGDSDEFEGDDDAGGEAA